MPISVTFLGQSSTVSGSSVTVSFAATSAGDVLVASGQLAASSGDTISMSDSSSDTATDSGAGTVDDTGDGTLVAKSIVKAFFTPTVGTTSVTITNNTAVPGFGDLFVWKVTGLTSPQFDKVVNAHTVNPAAPDSGPTGTLSVANEACFGYGYTGQGFTTTPTGNWTVDAVTTGTGSIGEHQIVSSNASIDGTGNLGTAANARMWCFTLQSAVVGGAATQVSNRTTLGVGI